MVQYLYYIPNEIQLKILLNLPTKSLVRFRLVCKSWNSIITDDDFCILHHHRLIISSNNNDKSYPRWVSMSRTYYPGGNPTNLTFYDESFTTVARQTLLINKKQDYVIYSAIIGSCHGLLCLYVHSVETPHLNYHYNIYLYNLAISQLKRVISFEEAGSAYMFGFGYAPQSKDYKIIIVKENSWSTKVYSLRKNTWIIIEAKQSPPLHLGIQRFFTMRYSVYCNGVCHWLNEDLEGNRMINILCFNLEVEDFGYIKWPDLQIFSEDHSYTGSDYDRNWALFVYKDMLAVFFCTKKNSIMSWHVWVMKEYGVYDSWTPLIMTMDHQLSRNDPYLRMLLEKDNDGEIVLHAFDSNYNPWLMVYNPRSQKIKLLEVMSSDSDTRYFRYDESLLLLEK